VAKVARETAGAHHRSGATVNAGLLHTRLTPDCTDEAFTEVPGMRGAPASVTKPVKAAEMRPREVKACMTQAPDGPLNLKKPIP
jgi:hypothetical protein